MAKFVTIEEIKIAFVAFFFSYSWSRTLKKNLELVGLKVKSIFHGFHTYITYIHNWSLRPFSQDYWPSFSHHLTSVNFIHKWRDLQFKVDSESQIIWETFHSKFYLLSEFLPEICWEEIAEKILFVFCFDVWPWLLLDHGDFIHTYITTWWTVFTHWPYWPITNKTFSANFSFENLMITFIEYLWI